jgi:hypothetical protein
MLVWLKILETTASIIAFIANRFFGATNVSQEGAADCVPSVLYVL